LLGPARERNEEQRTEDVRNGGASAGSLPRAGRVHRAVEIRVFVVDELPSLQRHGLTTRQVSVAGVEQSVMLVAFVRENGTSVSTCASVWAAKQHGRKQERAGSYYLCE